MEVYTREKKTGYEKYIDDVLNNRITVSNYVRLQVERLEAFKKRDDMYFDKDAADRCIHFFSIMKHFLGKSAGQPFILLPWQEWVVSSIIGIKWKATGYRVCKETLIFMARKGGKSSLIAGLSLYMLLVDGEQSPEIACLASSREQASLIFDMAKEYGHSIDPNQEVLKPYRNYLKCSATKGQMKVYSSDSARLDGLNISFGVIDEWAVQKDNLLYSVIKSSMGMRTQPLLAMITSANFLLEGYPCFEMYKLSIEILNNIKQDESFFPFLYCLDPDDDYEDENVWIKANPNLDITVTREYLRDQVRAAKNDATQEVPVKTKNFNMWCQSSEVWIPQTDVVKCMQDVDITQYEGNGAYIGVDLSSVDDMTAVSIMIPYEDKFIFKTWCYVPEDTVERSANKELYRNFIVDGSLIRTSGNIVDYDIITNKLAELNGHYNIQGIYFDPWNSGQWSITCTELGFNMQPISQNYGGMSTPTKEMAKNILGGNCIIDKSRCVLWSYGNAKPKLDPANNIKITKDSNNKKIDPVISQIICMAGYLKSPYSNDWEITII